MGVSSEIHIPLHYVGVSSEIHIPLHSVGVSSEIHIPLHSTHDVIIKLLRDYATDVIIKL